MRLISTLLTAGCLATAPVVSGCGDDDSEEQPVCTFRQDQSCNDDLEVSTLEGTCNEDGACTCNDGYEKTPRPASVVIETSAPRTAPIVSLARRSPPVPLSFSAPAAGVS
jgi:hypothetical protein